MALKHVHWGWEEWAAGQHEFSLKFQSPIKLIRMDGFFTAGPPITMQSLRVQRQCLCVMTCAPTFGSQNYPVGNEVVPYKYTTTTALNHTVAKHLWAINIKQHGNEQAFVLPVNHPFPPNAPMLSELMMYVDNVGWTMNPGPVPFPSGDQVLPLALELQVIIQYEQV